MSVVCYAICILLLFIAKGYLISKKNDLTENDEKYGLVDLEKQLHQIELKKKLCIVIVGDGIKEDSDAKGRPYAKENAQGYDVYEGIQAAIANKAIDLSLVDFLYIDDGGIVNCAKRIGQIISKSKIVLCVIGHTSSSTTLAALPYYKMADIPIIMPVATNPNILKGYEDISFRMPTNDKYQAKFIADFVLKDLNPKNICIIWDETSPAKEYSTYLKEKLEESLGAKVKRAHAINYLSENQQTNNISSVASTIPVLKPDLIIYCGYGSLAKEFFTALRIEYNKSPSLLGLDPKIILTDGCNVPEISMIYTDLKFNGYLAFPSELGKDAECFKVVIAKDTTKFNKNYSYELFGYDAINLLASVLKSKGYKAQLNRNYVSNELKKGDFTFSTCYQYYFKNGENQSKSYSIYSIDSLKLFKKNEGNNIN